MDEQNIKQPGSRGLSSEPADSLRILLLKPDARAPGGVANYYSAILDKFEPGYLIDEFNVGRRPGFLAGKLLYPLRFLLDCALLFSRVLFRKYDVIHLNPSLNPASFFRDSLFVLFLWPVSSARTLIFFRGWNTEFFEKIVSSTPLRVYFLWFCRRGDKILVLASSIQSDLVALGIAEEKIELTNTTFDGSILETTRLETVGHATTGLETTQIEIAEAPEVTGVFTFLFMSRLIREKGISELIAAAKIYRDRGFQFSFIIAGSGPFEEQMRREITAANLDDIVICEGYLRGREKGEAFLKSDCFVFPTYHGEGCPNCILEAMGAGLPVITTTVGGIPDVVRPPEGGILLEKPDPLFIANAMQELFEDKDRREMISVANRRIAWKQYESKSVAGYLQSVYRDLSQHV